MSVELEKVARCLTHPKSEWDRDPGPTAAKVHAALNDKTLCGKVLNEMWAVLKVQEAVTCPACKKAVKELEKQC